MTTIKRNTIKYLLSIAILALFANGCGACPNPDYTTEIKEILDPVAQILEDFYTKNKRFPNTRERNNILQDRGCSFGKKGAQHCKKYGVWFEVSNSTGNSNDYTLDIKYRSVSCSVRLMNTGLKVSAYPWCREQCGYWGH